MSEPIISVSGLRGLIGEQLTPEVAVRYTAALAATLPQGGTVVIGRDGRGSGRMLAQAVSASLQAHGLQVANLGCVATPTVGVEVRRLQAVAGIQISASHNPKEYNGLKLFCGDGRVLPREQGEAVLAAFREGQPAWANVDSLGTEIPVSDPLAAHLELVLKTVDVAAISSKNFQVLLDANHGAGAALGRRLLESLGCSVSLLGEEPNGLFWHPPEPLAANLIEVSAKAEQGAFDVTFCQDPDADRLAVIDECGRFIGEELTLALCLREALPQGAGPVVINCATSSVSKLVAEKFNCPVIQSAVGEANVCDAMLANQAVFGGEGNGGPIDPAVGLVRDSFVGMARILSLLAQGAQSLSQLVAELPELAMRKDKIQLDAERLPELFEQLQAALPDAYAEFPDGLKLQWPDRWLLVRGSNTEPIVRLIVEAPTDREAEKLCHQAAEVAQRLSSA